MEWVLARIKPEKEEIEHLHSVVSSILDSLEELARQRGVDCLGILVGSAARDTWLAGDHDLDIFLTLPPQEDLSRGLDLAREMAPDRVEKYAEHPYVQAIIQGFRVDLVPCYRLKDALDLKSSVDRTPFHTKYVSERIGGLEDQVRLLKQFMKGIGVYGSELRRCGFSGYLAELLVLNYGSFRGVLEGASSWQPGTIIDLEGHGTVDHRDPLVVVDPVDPNRNVAAALALDRMAQMTLASRRFLATPREEFFFPPPPSPVGDLEFLSITTARGTRMIAVEFEAPDVVEDVLFPQLRKAEAGARDLLNRNGFAVLRSDVYAYGGRAIILLEMEIWKLPSLRRHLGPPFWEAGHVDSFLEEHPLPLSGPYLIEGRAAVEIPRKYTEAEELLARELPRISLGKHISQAVRIGYEVLAGPEILRIAEEDFRRFLRDYLQPPLSRLLIHDP